MAPRNRFETEYNANFKPHEVTPVLSRQPHSQIESNMKKDTPQKGLKKKDSFKPLKHTVNKENRALQYKAGLAPSMKSRDKLRYLSEYKKQFNWKKPLEYETPILSAEKVIHGVHGDVHPTKASKVKIPKKTEYQLQFVKHPIISTPVTKRHDLVMEGGAAHNLIEWKEPSIAAGKPSGKQIKPSPAIPRRTMVFQSEYHANFKSPTKYEYIKGSWVGARHPHVPHPDEVSDSENKPTSNAWYQQVIELREKVRSYSARAREGTHFINLLKNLQERGIIETPNDGKEKPSEKPEEMPSLGVSRKPHQSDNLQERGIIETPNNSKEKPSEQTGGVPSLDVSKKATGPSTITQRDVLDKDRQDRADGEEIQSQRFGEEQSKTRYPAPPINPSQNDNSKNTNKNTSKEVNTKRNRSLADEGGGFKTSKLAAGENIDPQDGEKNNIVWNRQLDVPGPLLEKTHSVDTISHESTITSSDQLESSPCPARREAWPEYRPARALVVPPYGISSSSATLIGSDSRSDISLSEAEQFREDNSIASPNDPVQPTISSATRRLFTGRREDLNSDRRKIDSFSSDDETSIRSFSSKASDVLSVEAMNKRRDVASETLMRARRRQAQL